MADTYIGLYPFAYNNEYYVYTEKEEAKKEKFISFMTQRNAQYMEPAEEVYNNKKLDDTELLWESFRDNIEPPTPQLQVIDGYDSAEECSGGSEDGDSGDGSQDGSGDNQDNGGDGQNDGDGQDNENNGN